MIKLLEQAIAQNSLRPLDLRFAQMLVADENPILLFIFAYLSAKQGRPSLNIIQQDKLFDGRHTELTSHLAENNHQRKKYWQSLIRASVLIKAI